MSENLDQVFGQLVKRSWERFDEQLETREIDDMLVGAVITATVAQGNALIDLTSNEGRRWRVPSGRAAPPFPPGAPTTTKPPIPDRREILSDIGGFVE